MENNIKSRLIIKDISDNLLAFLMSKRRKREHDDRYVRVRTDEAINSGLTF